jgi:hypothetical protein
MNRNRALFGLGGIVFAVLAVVVSMITGHDSSSVFSSTDGVISSLGLGFAAMGNIDLYNTRTMLRMLQQLKTARTFILDTFFTKVPAHTTEAIDIDIIDGKRRLAPFVSPRMKGKVMEKLGRHTESYKPAYVKPKMVTTAEDLLVRQPGELVYQDGLDLQQRAATQLANELTELNDMITRREEWMAAQAVQTGKIIVKGEGVDDVVDFGMKDTHLVTLAGTALWSAKTTAKPIDKFREWCKLINKDAGVVATDAILGSEAYLAMLGTDQIASSTSSLFNMLRVNMGIIDPQAFDNGVTYIGHINELGLDLWTYDEYFVDDDTDQEGPMIDPKRVVVLSRKARFERHFGAIKDLKALAPFERFPKVWEEDDPSVRMLMVQSAPLPCPHQKDAIVSAKVLA